MSNPMKPVQLENTFTDEEYSAIYKHVYELMDKGVREHQDKYHYLEKLTNNGFIAIMSPDNFDISIGKKLRSLFANYISDPVNPGFLFARYTWDSGDAPTLMPHCDRSEKFIGCYGTVQLDSTLDWDFYVEDEKFQMNKNSSVWFTGTHQPHWRPDRYFGPEDYYDILLAQSHTDNDPNPLTEQHYIDMDVKSLEVANKYKDTLLKQTYIKTYSEDGCQ